MAKGIIKTTWVAETSNYNKGCKEAKKALDNFGSGLGINVKALMSWQAGVASATVALGAFVKSNIETAKNFEKSMSSLSALTGMTGKNLDQLKNYAIELGGSTTETASQVAEAFKIIGSAKPELLSSAEGLRDVTKAAITLGEAAGIEVPEAASALTTSLNQMGEGADAANRFVNVLAAASQKGAGDINWLRDAIVNSGTAAKAVGTSYEELVANLEQLAQGGFDASSAGTALRSIIMSLEKQSETKFKPSIVGLTEAFKNLGDAHFTISQYQKIVGKEFASQAQILASNAEKADSLTTAITGTHIAEEQAETNTNNLEGAISRLSSAWEQFNLSLNSSNGVLKSTVDWLASVIGKVNELFNNNYVQEALKAKGYKSYKDESSRGRQIGSFNTGKRAMERQIAEKQKEYDDFVATTNKYYKGSSLGDARVGIAAKMKSELDALKNEYHSYVKGGKDFFSGKKNTITTPTTPDGLGGGGGTTTTKKTGKTKKVVDMSFKVDPDSDFSKSDIERISKLAAENGNVAAKLGLTVDADNVGALKDMISGQTTNPDEGTVDDFQDKLRQNAESYDYSGIVEGGKKAHDAWMEAANAVGSVGQALQQIDNPAAKVFGIIAEAVANVASGFAQALANSKTGHLSTWAWIAEAAAGTATMISTIAAIKSATSGSYAEGGIIGGTSFSGDRLQANVNSGELILNRAQQGNLASQLQGTGMQSLHLETSIKGSDLRVVLNNDSRHRGKGEYVTSR